MHQSVLYFRTMQFVGILFWWWWSTLNIYVTVNLAPVYNSLSRDMYFQVHTAAMQVALQQLHNSRKRNSFLNVLRTTVVLIFPFILKHFFPIRSKVLHSPRVCTTLFRSSSIMIKSLRNITWPKNKRVIMYRQAVISVLQIQSSNLQYFIVLFRFHIILISVQMPRPANIALKK